jgi:hypothetical protein
MAKFKRLHSTCRFNGDVSETRNTRKLSLLYNISSVDKLRHTDNRKCVHKLNSYTFKKVVTQLYKLRAQWSILNTFIQGKKTALKLNNYKALITIFYKWHKLFQSIYILRAQQIQVQQIAGDG